MPNPISQIIDRISGVVADRRKKEDEEKKRREANSRIIKEEQKWRSTRQIFKQEEFDTRGSDRKKIDEQHRKEQEEAKLKQQQREPQKKNFIEKAGDTFAGLAKSALDNGFIGGGNPGGNIAESLIRKTGELAQKIPDTTIKTSPVPGSEVDPSRDRFAKPGAEKRYDRYRIDGTPIETTELGGKAIPFLSGMAGGIVKSVGNTLARDPKDLYAGVTKIPKQVMDTVKDPKKALDLLNNPAVEDAMNVSDLFSLGTVGLARSGIKKAGKEALEKEAKVILEKQAAEVIEKEAARKATTAMEKKVSADELVQASGRSELPLTSAADEIDESSRLPLSNTSIADTGDPSSAVADISSPSTVTDTRTPSSKYTPGTSAKDILDDPSFISKYNSTIQEKPFLDDVLKNSAGGREVKSGTKELNTAAEKVVRKLPSNPDYNANDMADLVRGSVYATDADDAKSVLASIQKNADVIEVENYLDAPNPWGYQGININVKTPKGNLAEIQIHTAESRKVQKALHPLYEQWRNVPGGKIPVSVFEEAKAIVDKVKTGSPVDDLPLTTPKLTEDGLRVSTRPGSYTNVGAIDNPLLQAAEQASKKDPLPFVEPEASFTPPPGDDVPSGMGGEPPGVPDGFEIDGRGKLVKTKDPNKYEFDLKSLNTPDEVKDTILSVAAHGNEAVQAARRGTITFKETRAMADALGMSADDVEKRMAGKIFNAEQADAATRMALKAQEELTEVGQLIRGLKDAGHPVPDAVIAKQMEAAARAKGILASVIGSRSEAARSLNAAKMMKEALDSGDSKLIRKAKEMFAGSPEKADAVIAKLSEFDPEDNLGKIKFLQSVKPSTLIDKVEELWYNSVLSGPATHVVNNVGNAINAFIRIPEKAGSAVIDSALANAAKLFNVAYKQDHFAAQIGAELAGVKNGIGKGVRKGFYVLRNGVQEADVLGLDVGRGQAIKGPVGAVVNIPSRSLVAADEIWRGINNEMTVWEDAVKAAKQEGLKGDAYTKRVEELVADPTPEMIHNAAIKSKARVFQQDGNTEKVVRHFRDNLLVINFEKLEKIPGIRSIGTFRPTRFILPFVKTPINVVKFGAERTPLGVLPLIAKIGTGAPKEEVIEQMAKMMIGSAVTIPLAMYFSDGKLTGAAPKDRKLKDAFYADGKLPWSVKIGDRWVAYNRVEPLNSMLSQVAIWHDAFEKNGEVVSVETVSDFLRGFTRNFADQTFMTGLGNLMDAVEDPERFGQKFITDITGGFIPSVVAAGARSMDDTIRKPETLLDSFAQRLPLLSKDVPAMPSSFEPGGEAVRHTQDNMVSTILSNFVGLRSSKDTGLDVLPKAEEIQALNKESKAVSEKKTEIAEQLYIDIKAVPKDQRQKVVEQYKKDGKLDDVVLKKFVAVVKEKKIGELTADQKVLKGATTNRAKASYMYDRLKAMDSDKRNDYIRELLEKKVISENVVEEIAKLAQERKMQNLPLTNP